jgi:hypothetical protein
MGGWDSVVYMLRGQGFKSWQGVRGFIFIHIQTSPGTTQPPLQEVPGFFDRGKLARGMALTTHLHLQSKLRMITGLTLLPYVPPLACYRATFTSTQLNNLKHLIYKTLTMNYIV